MIDSYIIKYGKRLYGLCLTLCKNKDFADDLYQETWLKALNKIESYDSSHPFDKWLTKICVNTYRDYLRKIKRNPVSDNFQTGEDKDSAIENVCEKEKEDYSDLHAAIEKLPEKLRLTVILHYFNGLDEKSTACALGIPLGTVKSRLNKARKILREELCYEQSTF